MLSNNLLRARLPKQRGLVYCVDEAFSSRRQRMSLRGSRTIISYGQSLMRRHVTIVLPFHPVPGRQAVCLPAPVSLSLPVLGVASSRDDSGFKSSFPPGLGGRFLPLRRLDSRRLFCSPVSTHGVYAETQFLSVQLSRFCGGRCFRAPAAGVFAFALSPVDVHRIS